MESMTDFERQAKEAGRSYLPGVAGARRIPTPAFVGDVVKGLKRRDDRCEAVHGELLLLMALAVPVEWDDGHTIERWGAELEDELRGVRSVCG